MPLINNEKETVKDIVNNILPLCDEVFFEVGYFYFSGFEQIYKQLKDKKVNIIIGIDYDQKIGKLIDSNLAIKDNYFSYLKDDINNTDILDQKIGQDSYNLFVNKIKNRTLKIKCHKKKINHSKIFIFKSSKINNDNGNLPGKILMGSSNLTRSGFLTNIEGNHLFDDKVNFEDYFKRFQKLWLSEDCIDIVDDKNFIEFEEKVLKKTWINKNPSPYYLFIKVLDEYFQEKSTKEVLMPDKLSDGKFLDVKYQEDAIVKGLSILKKHQGVIIADVVGLGKSIIASAIAKNLNLNTIVICPPHLQDQWREYKTATLFPGEIESRGKIEKALDYERPGENLIIIDEAQSFRNDLTNDYSLLHKLCQGNKVILLSATPFNNKPQDIFNLVKLFQIPTKSSLQNIENLSDQFRNLIKEYRSLTKTDQDKPFDNKKIREKEAYIANEIRAILAPLVIRRSRIDLQNIDRYRNDLLRQNISFPKVNDPQLIEYDLGGLVDLYLSTLDTIAPKIEEKNYVGARYKSTSYVKDKYLLEVAERGGYEDKELLKKTLENIADFMKRLLVRRFESCIESFMKTLDAIIQSNQKIKNWYEKKGMVPIFKRGSLPDVEEFTENNDDEKDIVNFEDIPEIDNLKDKGLWFIKKEELEEDFYKDLINDIKILENLKEIWKKKIANNFIDPKFEKFKETLKKELDRSDKRKVLIFSEFADTANYISRKLKQDNFKVVKYTSADASKKENRIIIKKNFDASYNEQEDNFNVLVATDTIAEGYNLNRAGTIINYDIPYNPTKVIQRIGRINRINKKVYDELFIYNFFPTDTGEREVKTKKITRVKMSMFKALFGDDTKVLTKDEDLNTFFIDEYNSVISETGNPETYYENLIYNIRDNDHETLKIARDLPQRTRIMRNNNSKTRQNGILLYAKKGEESVFRFMDNSEKFVHMPVDHYLKYFESNIDEKSYPVSESFQKIYAKASTSLFTKNFVTALDRGRKESIDKLKAIKEIKNKYADYINDLIYVVEILDALPRSTFKLIKDIKLKNLNNDLDNLYKVINPEYIKKIILKASVIDEGEEKLIISEEIKNV